MDSPAAPVPAAAQLETVTSRLQSNHPPSPVANCPFVDAIAAVGEFLGTFLFFCTAYIATQAAKNSAAEGTSESVVLLLYISLAFALSLTANVWLFYRVSGGLFNPALTLAFVLLRLMTPAKGALLAASQLLAGIAAAGVAKALVPNYNLAVQTTLGEGVTPVQGFFIEFFLTAELALAVFMIAVEKHRATHMAPLVIGAALGVGHLVGASLTGASMNPARSLGPAVVNLSFASEHWIYCQFSLNVDCEKYTDGF